MADRVGQQFGKYRLLRFRGRGGFGDVYLGKHIEDKTQAAIKILHDPLTNENIKEFVNEASTQRLLRHSHIVRLLDFGIGENQLPYLVMEFAPNGSLADRYLHGTRLPLDTVISYVKPISAALQYAHSKELIHRDVKPANFLIDANGKVLLGDFGIAAVALSTRSLERRGGEQKLAGSWDYAAPEQFIGKAVYASDQYSLAIVVYEWLCGSLPFTADAPTPGEQFFQLAYQHKQVIPPPLHEKMNISPAVEQVIMRALAKAPDQRFVSVQKFAEAFEWACQTQQSAVLSTPSVKSPYAPVSPTLPSVHPSLPPHLIISQNQPWPSTKPITSLSQPGQPFDPNIQYREGAIARAHGDLEHLERAAFLWQQILDYYPNFGNGVLSSQMAVLLRDLHPLRVQKQRDWAEEAHTRGDWRQEINAWSALLHLQPQDIRARERLSIAEHNLRYAWIYENAKQLAAEGNLAVAKQQLEMLWHDAPYYGDPSRLAKKAGLSTPLSYEEAQSIIHKSQVTEAKKNKRVQRIEELGTTPKIIWINALCLLCGLGSAVGLLTQLWFWAVGAVLIVALFAYILGYRKVMGLMSLIGLVILSNAIASGLAWYASTYPYNSSQVGYLWFFGSQALRLGVRTILYSFGLLLGVNLGACVLHILAKSTEYSRNSFSFSFRFGRPTYAITLLAIILEVWFGFASFSVPSSSWHDWSLLFALIPGIIGVVSMIGLLAALPIFELSD